MLASCSPHRTLERKPPSLATIVREQNYIVKQGENLSAIAARLYENPGLWRPIAIANGIADPRAIVVGQSLSVPSLPFTDPQTGEVVR